MTEESAAAPQQPLLRVASPDATPEEIAALVAVFSAMGGGAPAAPEPVAELAAPHRAVRRTVVPTRFSDVAGTRGAWRSSGLPR